MDVRQTLRPCRKSAREMMVVVDVGDPDSPSPPAITGKHTRTPRTHAHKNTRKLVPPNVAAFSVYLN